MPHKFHLCKHLKRCHRAITPEFVILTANIRREKWHYGQLKVKSCQTRIIFSWPVCHRFSQTSLGRLDELVVFEYLKHPLTAMPNNHHLEHLEIIDNYLPWSANAAKEYGQKSHKLLCSWYGREFAHLHYPIFWGSYLLSEPYGSPCINR